MKALLGIFGVEGREREQGGGAFLGEAGKGETTENASEPQVIVVAGSKPDLGPRRKIGCGLHATFRAEGEAVEAQHAEPGGAESATHFWRLGVGGADGGGEQRRSGVDAARLREREEPLDIVVHRLEHGIGPGEDFRVGTAVVVAASVAVEGEQHFIVAHVDSVAHIDNLDARARGIV